MPTVDPETGEARYELRTRSDVLSVFSALAKSPIPVTLSLTQLGLSLTTRLIAANPAFEELVFDATGLANSQRLDGSAGLVGSAQMDAVWYRFGAEHVEAVRGYAQPAFRARLPSMILRMQRRDSIRYPVPALNPPVCDVLLQGIPLGLRVIDISLSGIAVEIEGRGAECKPGSKLENCLLQLPDVGAIQTDLDVVHLSADRTGGGRRLGCRFTNIRATALTHLQRYISGLERERLANEHQEAAVEKTHHIFGKDQ